MVIALIQKSPDLSHFLATQGQEGVEEVLDVLTEELSTAMALSGNLSHNYDPIFSYE